jgi:acetyl esterase/lipase
MIKAIFEDHGGGFVMGAADTYDLFLADFVTRLNMVIVSVK